MRILMAVDGSDHSYEAVRALSHVTRPDALILLHVLDVPRPAYPMMIPEVARDLYDTAKRGMREEGERVVKTAMSLLPLQTGSVTKRIEIGKPPDVIVTIAEQERVDLIVMASRGLGALRELMLGSVSHRVVAQAPCSTLVIRAPLQGVRSLILAVEEPTDKEVAVRFLTTMPFKTPCEATVMTVIPFTSPAWPVNAMIPESLREEMLAQARRFVEETAARLSEAGYRATGLVLQGAPATEILTKASKHHADLIVMGSRHRGIGRVVLGSVSHAVLHRTPCSVLVVR